MEIRKWAVFSLGHHTFFAFYPPDGRTHMHECGALPLPKGLTGVCVAQGGGLVWRVGEGHQPLSGAGDSAGSSHALRGGRQQAGAPRVFTKCGNQYPTQAQDTAGLLAPPPPPHRETSAVNVSTYGWVYVW